MKHALGFVAIVGVAAGFARAQPSNVSASHQHCWSENAGWIGVRDAGSPSGSQGLRIGSSVLSGYAWSENLGWIDFGDGTPTRVTSYSNSSGLDFGVNVNSTTGDLSGLAWGENVGWINFGWASAGHADRPRLEAGRLLGHAWGENIGWISFDGTEHYIAIGCPADLDDGSGLGVPDDAVTIDDLLYFLAAFEEGSLPADLDDGSTLGTPDGGVTIDDLLYFLTHFEHGC